MDASTGLISAGVVVLSGTLLVLKLVVPTVWGGTGIERADGPHWWRIGVQLAAGLVAELSRPLVRRLPAAAALAGNTALVGLCGLALWAAWWR